MTGGAALCFFIAFGIFSNGLTAVIQTKPSVMAAVGDKVSLNCQLMETKDVLQVTWQKISNGKQANVATYNKVFGETVNPGFKDKVEFEDAGLQNCSIVISNVTEQDEGCYLCLFNSYPEGALTGRTCLQVYELHQPVLHVRGSNSTGEVVVSCSATGRPAPTVTLRATQPERNLTQYDSVSVSNTNGTVTVTTTAVLSTLHLSSTQVGCRVGVLSGPQIEVLETIPGLKPTSADDTTWIFILLVLFVVACGCFAVFWIVVYHKKRNEKSLSLSDAMDDTPESSTKDTQRQTHCDDQDNEAIDGLDDLLFGVDVVDSDSTTTHEDPQRDTVNEPLITPAQAPQTDFRWRGCNKDEKNEPNPSPSTKKQK